MATGKISVLVVEDEPLVRINIVAELEDHGLSVLEASNAAEAISVLENNPVVNVLFTDVDMPGAADGLELARIVHERYPPVQVIVTSGRRYDVQEDLPPAGQFISKPYLPSAIVETILEMTRKG